MKKVYEEVLCEIRVDEFEFMVTRADIKPGACMLWMREGQSLASEFGALGWFAGFDRRSVLQFVTRYTTSERMRREVDKRKFARWVEGQTPASIRSLDRMARGRKGDGYRALFRLQPVYTRAELDSRRRILARRFHPDVGGDGQLMQLINRAYDELLPRARAA